MGIAVAAVGTQARPAPRPEPLVVHEWGTFVSMEGSDGLALEGLHHDEEDLPAFVHSRGKDQLRLHATRSKMETPVLYFYPSAPQSVHVRVDFPQGILTQWFPQVSLSGPRLLQGGTPPLKGGFLEWDAELTPTPADAASSSSDAMPAAWRLIPQTVPGHVWNYARETRAALVTAQSWDWARRQAVRERDRFLFYRGLGRFVPPLQVQSSTGGHVILTNTGSEPLRHLLLLRVEGGRGSSRELPVLPPGQHLETQVAMGTEATPMDPFVTKIGATLARQLVEGGLYPDEARAMVNTWSRSYFRTEGIRVLYQVPRSEIERNLPLKIEPAPKELTRVFIGRVECLSPEQEAAVGRWLKELGAPDPARARAARDGLVGMGRFVEPRLRRAARSSADPIVRERARALLQRDALNELRAAEREFPDELGVAAQLAATQRRAGLNEEAKAKGEAVLAKLAPSQPTNHVLARKWLRSRALATEAIGEPGAATGAYADWVRFAAGLRGSDCQACHLDTHVTLISYADLRQWWGGERLRSFAIASGKADALIARARRELERSPSDPQALVTLACLLPAAGDTAGAEATWAKLESVPLELQRSTSSVAARPDER
jgi:hypothetical protein